MLYCSRNFVYSGTSLKNMIELQSENSWIFKQVTSYLHQKLFKVIIKFHRNLWIKFQINIALNLFWTQKPTLAGTWFCTRSLWLVRFIIICPMSNIVSLLKSTVVLLPKRERTITLHQVHQMCHQIKLKMLLQEMLE